MPRRPLLNGLSRLVGRRVLLSVPVLLLASAASFVFVRATIDPLASIRADTSPGAVAQERHRLGLDRPLAAQYGRWLGHFVRGDWGDGIATGRPVGPEVRQALVNTGQLVLLATFLAAVLALAAGTLCATRPGGALDHALSSLSIAGASMPLFWFALVAIELCVFLPRQHLHLHEPLLYSAGMSGPGGGPVDYLRHAALPALTLSVPLAGRWSAYQRVAMVDALSAPFARTARAFGIPPARVLAHTLRGALPPLVAVMAADVGHLLGGVIVVETVFAWPGMGRLLYDSLLNGDTNVLLPWLMVAGGLVVAANLAAEILHGVLDPRVRSAA